MEGSSHWLPPQLQGLKLRLTPLGAPLNPPQDSQGCCQGARRRYVLEGKASPFPSIARGCIISTVLRTFWRYTEDLG